MQSKKQNNNTSFKGSDVTKYFTQILKEFLDLDHGVDKLGTIEDVKSKQSMSGANAWMLMCSIMIASIGLNLNSQAVIIGAMLISPLMSPILGIGMGVAINDKDALSHALMHFGAALIIALITSTLYFWISPLDEFTEQIEARTMPTFLDVLIAVFGGIAGIISIARKDISTTLPGVAIATALMPPLCVTGYGLANGEWGVASKSFYLFFLNTFFVAFATYVILRQMKFPYKIYASRKERLKNMRIVGFFSLVMLVPSFLIFKDVYQEYKKDLRVKYFLENYIGENQIYLDDYTVANSSDSINTLLLKVYGESINESLIPQYEKALDSLGLTNMKVEIIPTTEIKLEKVNQIESELTKVGERINVQIEQLKNERDDNEAALKEIKRSTDFIISDSNAIHQAFTDLKIFIPEINELGLANMQVISTKNDIIRIPTFTVSLSDNKNGIEKKLYNYFKAHYKLDTLKLVVTKN